MDKDLLKTLKKRYKAKEKRKRKRLRLEAESKPVVVSVSHLDQNARFMRPDYPQKPKKKRPKQASNETKQFFSSSQTRFQGSF